MKAYMESKFGNLLPAAGILALALLPAASIPAQTNSPIPWSDIGAVAGKQYQSDGLSVSATEDGTRLRCLFSQNA
jgi:hypothetical protein